MNDTTSRIENDAREWFVRLRDEAVTPEDIVAWEAWLRADAAHGAAYDAIAEVWMLAEGVALPRPFAPHVASDGYDGSETVEAWRARNPARRALMRRMGGLALAASIAAVVWVRVPPLENVETSEIATARAQHKDAVLPDGSKIMLGAMTNLKFTYAADRRTVVLQSGEALFSVVHEKSRPFVVKTALGDITAVGTAFDVNVGAGTVVVSVTEGVVSVDPAAVHNARGGAVRVAAGQKLAIDPSGARLARIDAEGPPSWMQGRLEYRNQALEQVLSDVNRYSDQPIRLSDPALRALAYTGTVRLSAITPWALGLGEVFPLEAEKAPDGTIVLTRKKATP